MPEIKSNVQSFIVSFLEICFICFQGRKRKRMMIVKNNRYIPKIEAGASDHLTRMDEKEMATTPINNGIVGETGNLFSVI